MRYTQALLLTGFLGAAPPLAQAQTTTKNDANTKQEVLA